MPIYEYQCQHCDHCCELLQKFTAAPTQPCPNCDSGTLQRLISAPRFKLKGTGWYETDFKTPAKKEKPNSTEKTAQQTSTD